MMMIANRFTDDQFDVVVSWGPIWDAAREKRCSLEKFSLTGSTVLVQRSDIFGAEAAAAATASLSPLTYFVRSFSVSSV